MEVELMTPLLFLTEIFPVKRAFWPTSDSRKGWVNVSFSLERRICTRKEGWFS